MLIFLSDLHFIDETAGAHNIPAKAFEGVFRDIWRYCDQKKINEVKVVFLGDVFDLIRTTAWYSLPEDERPWGDTIRKASQIEGHANRIMDGLLAAEQNQSTFAFFRDGLDKMFGPKLRKIYIPGNHDRLCNLYPSLRKKVRTALGVDGDDATFPYVYDDKVDGNKYGVFARHGHEYDIWNYEGSNRQTADDYARVPIGDLIVAEFISKLPPTVLDHLDKSMPQEQRRLILSNLQEVDNVRPFLSVFEWIFRYVYVARQPELENAVQQAIRAIAREFESLKYYKQWKRNRPSFSKCKMIAQVEAAIQLGKCFDISTAEKFIHAYASLSGARGGSPDDSDKDLNEGAKDFFRRAPDYRHLVMGHTHNPLQMPVQVTMAGNDQVYVNTGTWRKRYVQGASGGFVGLKYVTYSVFYSQEENPGQYFETWTGTLKEI